MFGGHGIYHDGVMIGLIASGVFYLKVHDGNRSAFEAEGSEPFTYRRKGKTKDVAMSYWEVPADVSRIHDDGHLVFIAGPTVAGGGDRKQSRDIGFARQV